MNGEEQQAPASEEEQSAPVSEEDLTKALVDKLKAFLDRGTTWTGHGYLYVIKELELEPEFTALRKTLYPEQYPEPQAEQESAPEAAPAEQSA